MTEIQEFDQKAATFYSVAQFLAEGDLPAGADIELELFFLPGPEAREQALLKALKSFGYEAAPGEVESGPAVVVRVATTLNAQDIWQHEARTSKLAHARGFTPDGWGFLAPE